MLGMTELKDVAAPFFIEVQSIRVRIPNVPLGKKAGSVEKSVPS